jgi:hypothetical protein
VLIAFVVANSSTYAQGNTTSSINGNVYDSSSQSLPGASFATHTASGTRYTATTDIDGNFRISNMRVGGPYQIIVSYVGFVSYDVNNVYLQLGTLKILK